MQKNDIVPVQNVLHYLRMMGCPNVRLGQGTSLFPQRPDGTFPLTPDLVAGNFHGTDSPLNFYIDVYAPGGQYMTLEKAGAKKAAKFFTQKVRQRGQFSLAEIPSDYAIPLTDPILKKVAKYGTGRGCSPLLGVVAYFCDRAQYGGAVMASLVFVPALHLRFGEVPVDEVLRRLLGAKGNTLVVVDVQWALDAAFVVYLRRLRDDSFAAALFRNQQVLPRIAKEDEVGQWLRGIR